MMYVERVAMALVHNNAYSATQFVGPKEIVRATRRLVGGKVDKREKNITIVLTIGRPNFEERKFVKLCQRANVKFPLAKVQLRMPPKKKSTA